MKAIVNKQTKLVPYLFEDHDILKFSPSLRSPIRASDITEEAHDVVTVPEPEVFVGNALKYDDGWEVVNQEAIDEQLRPERTAAIKEQYTLLAKRPVEINDIVWTGGDSSAGAISGAVSLAQAMGEETVTLWDYENVSHEGVSFEDAMGIAAQIGLAYRNTMLERNEKLSEVSGE